MHDDLMFNLDETSPIQSPPPVDTIFKPLAESLKHINNQPDSMAAILVLRQVKQSLDDIIQQHANNKAFIAQLFLLAIAENNLAFIKLLQQRCERYFGKSAMRDFLFRYRNDKKQSFFAFAVARGCELAVIKHFIDEWTLSVLVKHYADDEYLDKLLFLAVAQNDCRLLTSIKDELEKAFGRSSAHTYLSNCRNSLEQSLLAYAIACRSPLTTLQYLVGTLRLLITQDVIFQALHSSSETALHYFFTCFDAADISHNRLIWLNNVLTAYKQQYGVNAVCQSYQAKIEGRCHERRLFLTFEKEEVIAKPRSVLLDETTQENKQIDPSPKKPTTAQSDKTQQCQHVTQQLQQAEHDWKQITQSLQTADRLQQQLTFELKQLAAAKKYIAAEVEAKQTLSRVEQLRLTRNPEKSFINRGLHWLLDFWDVPSRQACQQKQATITAAKQTQATTKTAFKTICRILDKRGQAPVLENVQALEHEAQQKQQDNRAQLAVLSRRQHDVLDQIGALQKTLRHLEEAQPAIVNTVSANANVLQTEIHAPHL
jgi:hypothetical protein